MRILSCDWLQHQQQYVEPHQQPPDYHQHQYSRQPVQTNGAGWGAPDQVSCHWWREC